MTQSCVMSHVSVMLGILTDVGWPHHMRCFHWLKNEVVWTNGLAD